MIDDDGDCVVRRRQEGQARCNNDKIDTTEFRVVDVRVCIGDGDTNVTLSLYTVDAVDVNQNLENVGLQIWNGAFVMVDYILQQKDKFQNKQILELGTGVGLVGLVASRFSAHVWMTDTSEHILNNALRNVRLNSSAQNSIHVGHLDWTQRNMLKSSNQSASSNQISSDVSKLDLILASDPIYDNDLTEAFMNTALKLMLQHSCPIMVVSVEKRVVFTLREMRAHAPAYEYWRSLFVTNEEHAGMDGQDHVGRRILQVHGFYLVGRQVQLPSITTFPDRARPSTMELWEFHVVHL